MRKSSILFLFAAMVLLAGCVKETPALDQASKTLVVSIAPGIESTKTHMGPTDGSSRKLYWSDGDIIAVNGTPSDALADMGATATEAAFHFSAPIAAAPFNLLYPASIWADATHVNLPATQTYAADGFASGMYPMAGYSTDGTGLSFHHLCAVVKVSVVHAFDPEGDINNLASASFKGRNGEQVSGNFSINYSAATLTANSDAESGKHVQVVQSQSIASGHVAEYYIVVPARTYANGFDLVLTDVKGNAMTASYTGSVTLVAGKLYHMNDIQFEPTTISGGIEISTAEDLIAFATDYNNGVYDSLGGSLLVSITNDIVFDAISSTSFNETTGIGLKEGINVDAGDPAGSNDYYFNGTFNGNNHVISGLEATVPLFVATGAAGKVKNLTLDNTCSFTFTHANTGEGMFAGIVGYHKGTLNNVNSAADVTLSAVADVTQYTTVGGLVARATTGTILNSEYSGLISLPAGFTSTAKVMIGGLVGRFSNDGVVSASTFAGAISNEAQVTSTDKSNPYLIIGGVVGHLAGGAGVTTTSTTADHADVASAYSGFNGKIVNKTTVAYNSAVGGIVGELANGTVSSCTNAATIANSIYKVGADGSRYMSSGGIAGKVGADGTVTDCTNNGSVEHRSNPKLQRLGGIAGTNAGTITGCTNNAAVNQMTSGQSVKAGRIVSLGGVIGENAATATVSDIHNTAAIQISSMEDGTASDARMGGVIAYNEANINGLHDEVISITNTGQVYFSPSFTKQFLGYEIGGVVGLSTASVQNVKNSGYVCFRWNSDANVASKVYLGGIVGRMDGAGTIGGCVNEGGPSNAGEVYPNVKSGSAGHNNIFAGGILGYSESNVTISDCSNSGYVHGGNGTRVNGTSFYVGGIVAYLKGASSIIDCANTGQVNNSHNNNNDTIGSTPLAGGIAGYVEGTSEARITIGGTTGCSVDAVVVSYRGWVAGIAGYAKYVNLSNCSAEQNIDCAARGIGGLVGKAEYCNLSSSAFNGSSLKANNVQETTGEGGIVGNLSNSTVDGCSCYATSLTNNVSIATVGTIVGVSGENNTIQNCHYKPTITTTAGENQTAQIAGVGSFTDGGGNVADL